MSLFWGNSSCSRPRSPQKACKVHGHVYMCIDRHTHEHIHFFREEEGGRSRGRERES